MVSLPQPPLLLITDRSQARLPLEEVALAALEGGCRWISLREKDLPAERQIAPACRLCELAAPFEAWVMLHGDPRVAQEAGLFGVHLPACGDVRAARALLGPDAWISISTHGIEEIEAAAAAGADAVTLSPIFVSTSKPGYGPAQGLGTLRQATTASPIPIIALGGIEDEARVSACLEAGAAAIAVMGAVMRAHDPVETMARLVRTVAGRGDQTEPMRLPR